MWLSKRRNVPCKFRVSGYAASPANKVNPKFRCRQHLAADNGDHLHLSESPDQQKRQEWIAALDKMESLKPRAVIAGHKRVGNDDSPRIIGETRKYIRDFERLAMQTTTARELYDEMLKLYPDWINRGALWSSVRAIRT